MTVSLSRSVWVSLCMFVDSGDFILAERGHTFLRHAFALDGHVGRNQFYSPPASTAPAMPSIIFRDSD
jgi:hypothetical protein